MILRHFPSRVATAIPIGACSKAVFNQRHARIRVIRRAIVDARRSAPFLPK